MTGASASERERCERIAELCRMIWARRAQARCFAYLRVRSQGRVRELILGGGSLDAGTVTLIDAETAPLAEVFLTHEIDDEYELELDERRSIEGLVLDRAILRTRPDSVRLGMSASVKSRSAFNGVNR